MGPPSAEHGGAGPSQGMSGAGLTPTPWLGWGPQCGTPWGPAVWRGERAWSTCDLRSGTPLGSASELLRHAAHFVSWSPARYQAQGAGVGCLLEVGACCESVSVPSAMSWLLSERPEGFQVVDLSNL